MSDAPVPELPLPTVVRQTIGQLTQLLNTIAPRSAGWISEVSAIPADIPSVVVVGETNRGKSTLINALLAQPQLSPVDTRVATATYLVFRYGQNWLAQADYAGSHPAVTFPIEQLPQWVTANGELPDGQLPPRYVQVQAPIPLLTRLTLVDTPGVGGLDSMHGELAAEAAATATALLFVVDASAPFTKGELGFLSRVSEKVETVLFALTKIDQYRGWREILEVNKALLAEHAPRFADAVFYPVSGQLFTMAATVPAQTGFLLREQSGIAALQTALQSVVVAHAAMLAKANTLRALRTALREQVVRLEAEHRALTSGAHEAEILRARKEELMAQRRASSRGWQVKLRGYTQKARLESAHEVAREMRELQAWFRRTIDAANRETLDQLPDELDAALRLVSARVSTTLSQRLDQLANSVLHELFTAEELQVIRAQFARADAPPVILRTPDRRPPSPEDKLLVFMGVSGGLGLGKAAVLPLAGIGVAASSLIVLPVTIALGLGAGWWLAKTRKHSADKQYVKQWLTETIADARATMEHVVSEQFIDAEQQLSLAMDDALTRRIADIDNELRGVEKALRLDAEQRQQQAAVKQSQLAQVRAGLAHTALLLDRIRRFRDHGETQRSDASGI